MRNMEKQMPKAPPKYSFDSLHPLSQEDVAGMKSAFKSDIEQQVDKIGTRGLTDSHIHALHNYLIVQKINRSKTPTALLECIAHMSEGDIKARTKSEAEPLFRTAQRKKTKDSAIERYKKYGHKLLNTDHRRLYFPLITTNEKSNTENLIEEYLNKDGYFIRDYKNGYATDTIGKQEYKIGKLLKENIDLSHAFMKDETRILDQQCIVLSNYANDIAYMSTRRGWESCMSYNGLYSEEPPNDIKDGTVIAYLINKNDPYIFDPLARVLFKPLRNVKGDTIYHANKSYGLYHDSFIQTVKIISEQISSTADGLFKAPPDVYLDGAAERLINLPKNINAEKFLNLIGKDYTKAPSGKITVNDDLDLSDLNLEKLPDLTNLTITGDFYCMRNRLTSLLGTPQNIGGDFNCSNNQITSLEHAPQNAQMDFLCHNNEITSLAFAPKIVNGSFNCSHNNLTTLTNAPESSNTFYCTNNKLTSLVGAPKKIKSSFYCHTNQLTSLKGAPQEVGGSFNCTGNKLTSLIGGPTSVGCDYYCYENELTSLAHVSTTFLYMSSDIGTYDDYEDIPAEYLKTPLQNPVTISLRNHP